jgi:hypothetical protein
VRPGTISAADSEFEEQKTAANVRCLRKATAEPDSGPLRLRRVPRPRHASDDRIRHHGHRFSDDGPGDKPVSGSTVPCPGGMSFASFLSSEARSPAGAKRSRSCGCRPALIPDHSSLLVVRPGVRHEVALVGVRVLVLYYLIGQSWSSATAEDNEDDEPDDFELDEQDPGRED